jgi:hypothetical protein
MKTCDLKGVVPTKGQAHPTLLHLLWLPSCPLVGRLGQKTQLSGRKEDVAPSKSVPMAPQVFVPYFLYKKSRLLLTLVTASYS